MESVTPPSPAKFDKADIITPVIVGTGDHDKKHFEDEINKIDISELEHTKPVGTGDVD